MKREKALTGSRLRKTYIRERTLPTIWCSGCGIGIVVGSLCRAIDQIQVDLDKVVFTVGIGCSGFISRYLNFDVAHTTHGRALTVATGLKLANPELKVIALTGDGDGVSIGGNHFIHSARRNIGITNIVINNFLFSMTGGQYSPTTPRDAFTSTSPYGMLEDDFDICGLGISAGATFVARSTTYHVPQLVSVMAEAIQHEGFSLVEVLSQCPTLFGRFNRLGTPVDMLRAFRSRCVRLPEPGQEPADGKTPIGILHRQNKPELSVRYQEMTAKAAGTSHG